MENEKADCNCKHCMGILHCSDHRRRNHSAVTAYFPANLICKAREKLLFFGAAYYFFCYNDGELKIVKWGNW